MNLNQEKGGLCDNSTNHGVCGTITLKWERKNTK